MPVHPTPFSTAPNLHSRDWAGQIGKQVDPETKAPLAGWIYDCNQHGHTIRPYVPPRRTTPHATVLWHDTRDPIHFADIQATFPLENTAYQVWAGHVEIPIDRFVSAEFTVPNDFEHGRIDVNLNLPEESFSGHNADCNVFSPQIILSDPVLCPGAICTILGNPRTSIQPSLLQLEWRAKYRDAVAAWKALPAADKKIYNERAKRFGMTGLNLWIREYMLQPFSPE